MPSASARAADDAACREYAAAMLTMVKANAAGRCGGLGPQWSTKPAEHLFWCQTATNAAVKSRIADSRSYIEACRKGDPAAGADPEGPKTAFP